MSGVCRAESEFERYDNESVVCPGYPPTLASSPPCPGDGNIDYVVNQKDLDDWSSCSESGGLSSVYDFNLDGLTNATDLSVIEQNLGLDCR